MQRYTRIFLITLASVMLAFAGFNLMVDPYATQQVMFSGFVNLVMIFLAPFLIVAGLFIWGGIYHLCLLLLGTQSRGFGITLRAVAYSYGPNLLAIIPFCGGMIGGVWVIVLTILGAFYGHRTDAWRAVVAYLIPIVVCCGIMMVLWFLILGAVMAAQ